jgi:hypothetical protein
MKSEPAKNVIIRFSIPFRIAVLLVTSAALLVCIPLILQTIPLEAFGYLFVLLLFPGILVYGSFFVLTFQLKFENDRLAMEAIPNPFVRSFQCRYAEISGVEKDTGWSTFSIYRFREPLPYRISYLEVLEGSPIILADEIKTRIPENIFIVRVTGTLRRWWKWHKLLFGSILLLSACMFAFSLLEINGLLDFVPVDWHSITPFFWLGIIFLIILDLAVIRMLNREE